MRNRETSECATEQRMSPPARSVDLPPEKSGAVRMVRRVVVGIVAILVAAMLAYDYTSTGGAHPEDRCAILHNPC
jgi:hypothetical protein